MLDAALNLARKGKPVFPCRDDKRPYTDHGFKDATTDETQILQWWNKYPDALIGMPTGEASGIVVLDVDNKNGHDGDDALHQLQQVNSKLPDTPMVLTPSGGYHYYFKYPSIPIKSTASNIGDGLDIRGDGGYVIVPPSKPNGKAYEWEGSNPGNLANMPDWLVEKTRKQQTVVATDNKPLCDDEIIRIKSALPHIPSDDRDIWREIGMALHSTGHRDAFALWDAWSRSSDKYDAEDCRRVWNSFNSGAITIGTLFYHAQQNGWARLHTGKSPALTDMGNAERLVNSCGDDLRYCHETKTWLIWNGRYWEIDLDGGIQRLAKGVVRNIYSEAAQAEDATLRKTIATHAAKSESRERVKAMVQMAATESGVPVSILQLDKNPMLLNVANGTVDLRTGVLRQHDKYDIMTGYLPFDYNPGATSPLWGQFLTDVFQDDALIDYIHRSVGYTLTGNVSEQVMFFAYGKGANGKSTFLNVLNYLLGRHSVRISSQILTQKPDNNTYAALAGLKGARCVIASEVEEGQRMAESLVKDMTGGDKITARLLYGAFFEFMPTHKLWQYGNHKPQIRGTDEGIWRRIHLIPFTQSFRGKANIPDMDKRLMREIEGVLAWAIRGCLKWQQSGLCVPQVITDATAKYRQDEDIIGHFIAECAEKNSMESTRTSDGYRIYREWALESGYKPLGKQRFNEQMEDHKFYREHTRVGEVWLNLKVRPYVSV